MEFVRDDPLETDMRRRIAAALRAVKGGVMTDEEDREVWLVTGTASGARSPRDELAAADHDVRASAGNA